MANLVWLGEDDEDGSPGPSFTVWAGIKFPKNVAVEVNDAALIRKAQGNQFFAVEGDDGLIVPKRRGRPPKVKNGDDH